MTRRRAVVVLTDEDLHHLLALEPGERMVAAWPDPMRDSIVIGIEGDDTTDLPETIEGSEASRVERPYAIANLRKRLICTRDEEWRVTGTPFSISVEKTFWDEATARGWISQRHAPPEGWTDGPYLHRRTVIITEWEEA